MSSAAEGHWMAFGPEKNKRGTNEIFMLIEINWNANLTSNNINKARCVQIELQSKAGSTITLFTYKQDFL